MSETLEFLDKCLNANDTVVCATSGGVDSMSLLNILKTYHKKLNIICAHVNHNLREESFEEYEFVKRYCDKNNIIFEGKVLEKIKDGNLESKFREKRYSFFEEVVQKYNAKYLFTAHHGDDLIETVMMKIVRGSSIEGYSGFSKYDKRDNYILLRPLIYLTKDEIYKYAKENNIEYREDSTNESDKYTRNRYRKYILPKLKEENINVHKKFLKYSEELNSSYKFVNKYVQKLLDDNYKNNELTLNNIEDEYILSKVIYEILKEEYKDEINKISSSNIEEVLRIVKSSKPNLSIDLPNNIKVIKQYDILKIVKDLEKEDYKYLITDEVKIPFGIIKKVDETTLTNNYVCHLNSKEIKLPLYVRNRKDGDKIEILGLEGTKKIKDVFIDEKIPKEERDKYPLVVDSNDNILWIPGLKKSKYNSLKTKKYDIILWYMKEEI